MVLMRNYMVSPTDHYIAVWGGVKQCMGSVVPKNRRLAAPRMAG